MTYTLATTARILSATLLGVALTGCATVPGDPYYGSSGYQVYEQPGYAYTTPSPAYYPAPVYVAPPAHRAPPPAVYYGGRDHRDRDDRWSRDRDRDRAERDRAARDRAERDRREQQARDAANRDRAREQAERDRRAYEAGRGRDTRPGHIAPGSYTPHPHDWRSRQFENSGEKP